MTELLSSSPSISVIIPAYRAGSTIGACLDALFAAGFTRDEITVVDDGAPDDTVEVARSRGVVPLQPGTNRGAAQARNSGVAATNGELLYFVDADVVVHPDVRGRIERFFTENADHAAVFGSYDDDPPDQPRVSRIRNLLHHHVHQISGGPASTFWTGCGALRRADFEAAGGFRPEDEMIEDVGLGLRLARLGRPVVLDPGLQCGHLKRWSWRGFAWTDYRGRAMPWTKMMLDPENHDLLHVLNAGTRGKAAVICVGLSLLSIAALLLSAWFGLALALASVTALAGLERRFLALVARRMGFADAVVAVGVLWVHYLAAGAGYAHVRLAGGSAA